MVRTSKARRWRALSACACALALAAAGAAAAQENPLSSLIRRMATPQQQQQQPQQPQPQQQQQAAQQAEAQAQAGVQAREWVGYSLRFQKLRPLLTSGSFTEARTTFQTAPTAAPRANAPPAGEGDAGEEAAARGKSMADNAGTFLRAAEMGTMQFDGGDFAAAKATFDAMGQSIGSDAASQGQSRSGFLGKMRGAMRAAGRGVAGALGNAEMGAYSPPEYETVLQLNYLALSYLMLGDAAAFNVNLRSSEGRREAFETLNDKASRLQDEARAAFEQERAQAEQQLAQARADQTVDQGQQTSQGQQTANVESQLQAAYQTQDFCKPPNLPNAFVNPLGFYLSGVVFEVSSVQFQEDRDNARIAYEKALLLAPRSPMLQAAARELNRASSPANGRLVHAIVAEGFAPTRQVVRMNLRINSAIIPVNIPRLTCHPSDVARVELRSRGAVVARLDPIADIEGMMVQRQKDREGVTTMAVILNSVRGMYENRLRQQNAFANILLGLKQQNFDRPDMRSWSTLPARVHVARAVVPVDVSELQVVSLNSAGRVLATGNVSLDANSRQNVIYARATGQAITAAQPARLWVSGQ